MALESTPAAARSSKQSHPDLQEREEVFTELIKRANIFERQIVQRVDVIQEDHGKAILVFTIVSVALPVTVAVVALVLAGGYNASRILGWVSGGVL
ncbi:hypothetical protein BJX66DRAFT_340679 [Aspergillus keveii]|uniref:Uncharacterized protein n=1 Tax=Aspergillus keveii TaxID=714993 RepID=A0ABR4FXE4_9EURO